MRDMKPGKMLKKIFSSTLKCFIIENEFILPLTECPQINLRMQEDQLNSVSTFWGKGQSDKIEAAYGDKGYTWTPNREFLILNDIHDGIMRKDNINATLTDIEIERNKSISKKRYIVEQYFGISCLHDGAGRARFPKMIKNTIDAMFRQFAFNLRKGAKIL